MLFRSVLDVLTKPTKLGFFLGGLGGGVSWHDQLNLLDVLAYGRKHWFLTPPSHARYTALSTEQWLRGANESHLNRLREAGTLFECVQHPGDVMYLPKGWGHATFSEKVSLGATLEFVAADARLSLRDHT